LAAFTQLRLARAWVEDLRLPWERRYDASRLRPIRVHRVVSALLAHLGAHQAAETVRQVSRAAQRPALSGRAERYPVLKKSA
jgi:hypothetical protein